jgi:hypothetical protein
MRATPGEEVLPGLNRADFLVLPVSLSGRRLRLPSHSGSLFRLWLWPWLGRGVLRLELVKLEMIS